MLQPSYPIYGAKFYPSQVAELKKFAKKEGLVYIDHWSAWPDTKDPKLNEYLTEDQNAPSDKGIKVWSKYLA
ncbi:hypothetical protein [Bacillus rubiinfantis]|uniref:hypothetical protein n=1 Tax=Bacillus rubiinfantis TaxID=1499680 RepID=UPI000ABF2864|nr:hypothetical protein [Bacillus rubiinfantis]